MRHAVTVTMALLFALVCPLWAGGAERLTLAVSDLAAQGVKETEAAVISEQLRAELMKSPRIRLIERSQMQEILKEQGFQQTGCTDDACAVEVGQLLGVKNIVVGSVGMAGSYTVLSVRVIDVGTGGIIVNESIRTKGGINKVLETGISETVSRMQSGLFPKTTGTEPVSAEPQVKRSPVRMVLLGAGVAALAGGGIAVAVLAGGPDKPDDESPTPNTRIELP